MTDQPSRAVRLLGTEEEAAHARLLRAGPLTVELEEGNLRYLRLDGAEVLRAVSFVVRDRNWGTCAPRIRDLELVEEEGRFTVTYAATASNEGQSLNYRARIEGHADGRLTFEADGSTSTGFETNRTGFVVLHPIEGVAGSPVTVTHTDGSTEETAFPETIDPVQPMMDLRAIAHVAPSGLRVVTRMEGDAYEMEDQRNWSDASYKTYVRPLARPWPYRIEPGEALAQRVEVTVAGPGRSVSGDAATPTLSAGEVVGPVPPLGAGLRAEDVAGALAQAPLLGALGLNHLIVHHDPRAGQGRSALEAQLDVVRLLGGEPWLEVVVVATDDEGAREELAALGRTVDALGRPFRVVFTSPASDLKCTLPGSPWPPAPDAAFLLAAAREAFPGAKIGGGMFSYFTELNRKRPPTDALDLMTFTTSPVVHAGDDRSVMEAREAWPAIAASAARIAGGRPWALGPSAIGMRDNPYGAAAKDNPGNVRQAMSRSDPRQRGLFGAAWSLACFAAFAQGGASAVTLGGLAGPFGLVSGPGKGPLPWFDDHPGAYPAFHVLRGLTALRGATMRRLGWAASLPVAGLAAETQDGLEAWVANAGPDPVEVALDPSLPATSRWVAILDEAAFVRASTDPTFMDETRPIDGETIRLGAFAVARLVLR